MKGHLIIRPLTANLRRNTDFLSRMDPYVKLILGGQVRQSSVAYEAGKTPGWNDEISFYYNNEDILNIEVWDRDTLSRDDLVGSGSLAISTIQKRGNKLNDWIQLTYKGKDAGRILLDIKFIQEGYQGYGKNVMPTNYGVMQTGQIPQTFPMQQPQFQPSFPQQGYPQQQMYPQQMPMQTCQQPMQPVYQQVIPQQGYPQQQMYPQQMPMQQPLTKQVTYAPTIDQYGTGGGNVGYHSPGQFIPNNYAQQGTYPQTGGFVQQQGYMQKGYPY